MEIAVLSNRWIDEWRSYIATRFTLARMLPLVLLVAVASWLGSWPPNLMSTLVDLLLATSLVFQFRLWDDLCDLPVDRERHPERVLVRVESLQPYWVLLALVGIANAASVSLMHAWPAVFALLGLNAGLLVWYGLRDKLVSSARSLITANYHAVLLKYPAFVFTLAVREDTAAWPLAAAMAIVFLLLCVFEVLHDVEVRRSRLARVCAGVEAALLLAVGLGIATHVAMERPQFAHAATNVLSEPGVPRSSLPSTSIERKP